MQRMDNRVLPWDRSSISLVEGLPAAHTEATRHRLALPRHHRSSGHLLSLPLPAPRTRAARIQATRWLPRVAILRLPTRQLGHLAFQEPHLQEQQVLHPLQLPTQLQRQLLLAMHNTAKATHKAMAWLTAMGQVEATHREVLTLVPTHRVAQQRRCATLQGTLAMATTGLLSQLVNRLLLMVPMSSRVILLVPTLRLSELAKGAIVTSKDGKTLPLPIGILSAIEQWKKPQCSFQEFPSDVLPQTFLSVDVTPSKHVVFFIISFFFSIFH